jgi:hypothetical protein
LETYNGVEPISVDTELTEDHYFVPLNQGLHVLTVQKILATLDTITNATNLRNYLIHIWEMFILGNVYSWKFTYEVGKAIYWHPVGDLPVLPKLT